MRFAGGLISYIHTAEARKKLRYAAVAAAFLPIGQGLIQLLGPWLDDYADASLLAAAIVTFPNYFANKHFVWRDTSSDNLRKQAIVFWVVVMLAVLLATSFTCVVDHMMVGERRAEHAAAVFVAQVLGFGIVWVGRFLILDRWFFKSADETSRDRSTRSLARSRP